MVLPQVGPRAVPELMLADRPAFTPFTEDEFSKIPITAKGKVLKNQTDWTAFGDIADAAVAGYRGYIKSLFDAEGAKAGEAPAPSKWKFWK